MSGNGRQSGNLWTKDFILAIVVNLFISMVFYLLMTSMALYAVDRFQASDSMAGLAASSFIIGSVVARIFAGRLLEVVGRRRMILFSMLVFVAASLLYIPTGSLAGLLVLRVVHGIGFGLGNTAVAASAQALIPGNRRGEGTGYFGISTTLSTALGPFLAVLLAADGGYSGIFYFCAASSLAALIVAYLLRIPEAPAAPVRRRRFRLHLTDILEPAALPISTVILIAGASFSGILTFLTSYAVSRGAASSASIFFLVYAVSMLASRLFVGRIQDRRGDNAVMYPTLLAFALGLALLIPEPGVWTISGAAVLSGFGFGAAMPSAQAIAVKESPELRLGTATSTFYLLLDVGSGLGPILLGALVPFIDYPGMYAALAAMMLACVLLYYMVHGRKSRRPRAV